MEEYTDSPDPGKYEPNFFFRHLGIIVMLIFGFIFCVALSRLPYFPPVVAICYIIIGCILSIYLGDIINNRRVWERRQKMYSQSTILR